MCSLACGSALCAGLSVVGIVFLTSIGALYTTQPFFTTPDLKDAAQAAVQCYIGAGLYAAALLLSLYGMWFDTRRKRRSAALYDDESIADPLEREGLLSAEPPAHSPASTRHMRSAEFSRTCTAAKVITPTACEVTRTLMLLSDLTR
eukprot:9101-Heterococcus_DN1.PRE.4